MKTALVAARSAALFAALEAAPFLRVAAEAITLEALQAKAVTLNDEITAIVDAADEAGRDLTEAELDKIEAKKGELEKLDRQIAARSTRPTASLGRRATPEQRQAGRDSVPAEPKADAGRGGFRSFGEFAQVVRASARPGAELDPRIRAAAPSTAGNEASGADGGFAVPPDFRSEIWQKVMGEESLLSRCDQLVTGGNSITLPADETTPWQSSGGIQAYWESELAAINQSKPALSYKNIRLNKLTALVPVSEELLEDAPGMDSYLRTKAPIKMRAKLNTAVVRGTGVGQPMGILTSPSLITAAAISGQGAGTVVYGNIVAMWARMFAECRRNSVWLINQDIEPQLLRMAFDHSSPTPVPAYMPAGGASAAPFATLLGRPVIPIMPCSTLGTVGDIILADLSQYMAVTKGQDIKTDVSMHLFFDAAAMAYRFIMRVAGQPWWASTISPENGNNTLSWAVALSSTRT
jgi:HK97 family phage major capsid protein